jgi:arylsulfatase A-like enzyme
MQLIQGQRPKSWRSYVVSEYDYSSQGAAAALGVEPANARLFMLADRQWKYVHAIGFRPMLFDLQADPEELHDLGDDPAHEQVRRRFEIALQQWALRQSQRLTRSDQQIRNMRGGADKRGILIGVWDEKDIAPELWAKYRGET